MPELTPTTLPAAIRQLFELNHFKVEGPIQIHGAEIDLVAPPLSDPFANAIYIEVTVEYVDNDKYGKDVGKLALVAEKVPGARRLIVSAKGFSLPVKERARESRIETLTYDDLFKKFERFESYIDRFRGGTDLAAELRHLNEIYEEPDFDDRYGKESATEYLHRWRLAKDKDKGWLVVVGEYGTGKTALTKVLQYRWLEDYRLDPQLPLPLRIELREFAKQFDARGLLHYFLDSNGLGHLSIEYVLSLIRTGRAILLLDGYDEMAQYLNARERRTCLEALSELSADGARGILTSRPNYFTEAEELQVFEILYSSLTAGKYYLTADTKELIEREKHVDKLLGHFVDRNERTLRDLSPEQTESLVRRVLAEDVAGCDVVLGILRKTFRAAEGGDARALSGKPVIVSYLLEVVEGLKTENGRTKSVTSLTEWEVYKLIIDQLMLRDLRRSPEVHPDRRRKFLGRVAIFLSQREHSILDESAFRDLIGREFKRELSVLPSDSRPQQLDRYFADMRSSATLTRGVFQDKEGWRFSHNSLREYLVAELLINGLRKEDLVADEVSVTDAMKAFAASLSREDRQRLLNHLRSVWKAPSVERGRGQVLSLLWDGFVSVARGEAGARGTCIQQIAGSPPQCHGLRFSRARLSDEADPSELSGANFSESNLAEVDFSGADLTGADFSTAVLDSVNFANAILTKAWFDRSFLMDVVFVGSDVDGASFRRIDPSDISILVELNRSSRLERLEGLLALGYLRFNGALTDEISAINVLRYHPSFPVVDKIVEKLAEQRIRQRRGLEQRGAARQDVPLARRFVEHLEQTGLIMTPKNRKDLVEVTEKGRDVFNNYVRTSEVSGELTSFFDGGSHEDL